MTSGPVSFRSRLGRGQTPPRTGCFPPGPSPRPARASQTLLGLSLLLFLLAPGTSFRSDAAPDSSRTNRAFTYVHDQSTEMPWSMHILKVRRGHAGIELQTTLGQRNTFGMGLVSEQAKSLPPEQGQVVGAINGDFYTNSDEYPGRPRDLQIRNGELLTDPDGHACFWIGADGAPHMTNVQSRFRVEWPGGSTTPIGLNEERGADAAVLFSPAIGSSTRTEDGVELILAPAPQSPWLPLRPGIRYETVVRLVHNEGNAAVPVNSLVLSLGPKLASRLPALKAGARISLVTETIPDLTGTRMAIGGGPTLVSGGQAMKWPGPTPRHPRTAIGWNDDHFFLVEVDGRQSSLSVGMSFQELAAYMLRLGCQNAMNLDGGGSSTFWVLGNVINSPSEGRERPSANALVVVEKRPTAEASAARGDSSSPSGPISAPSPNPSAPATSPSSEPGAPRASLPTSINNPASSALPQSRVSPLHADAATPADPLFRDGAVLPVFIDLSSEALDQLRSQPRRYVAASLRVESESIPEAGVRLKGSTGSFRPVDDKPSFTIDVARFDANRRFLGLRRFQLNNSVEDPSYLNEKLGSEVFLAHGIPAPRVGYARVHLNGRHLGLYVLKEGFTEDFLARHFQSPEGDLFDNDLGPDIDQPLHRNLPANRPRSDTNSVASLAGLITATREPDPIRRWHLLETELDLDRFVTFTVLEVLLGHRDGYGLARNNFRLYRHPGTLRWTFLPDGMDQLFGLPSFPWQPRMSGIVAAAVLETPEGRARYSARFREVLDQVSLSTSLAGRARQIATTLRPQLSFAERRSIDPEVQSLLERIRERDKDLRRQITDQQPRSSAGWSLAGPAIRNPAVLTHSLP